MFELFYFYGVYVQVKLFACLGIIDVVFLIITCFRDQRLDPKKKKLKIYGRRRRKRYGGPDFSGCEREKWD